MEQMPQKGSQGGRVDGREAAKGLTPILEGLQCLKERRKSGWKKNLRAQTCWVKGVGNANH